MHEAPRDPALRHHDHHSTEPAYLCGRLLAVLEIIQRRAHGPAAATVADKFFGTASTAPALIFGPLLVSARRHVASLRHDPSAAGAVARLERELEDILVPLGCRFPASLTLAEQSTFSIGFYHQRATHRLAALSRAQGAESDHHDALVSEETIDPADIFPDDL